MLGGAEKATVWQALGFPILRTCSDTQDGKEEEKRRRKELQMRASEGMLNKKKKKKSIVFGCKSMTVYIIALLRMKRFTTIITSRHCLPLVPDSVYKTALECLWNK